MLEILNSYRWTRLSVRITGAINRQCFHMIKHVFDNSNLSQEIFAIDTWRAVICSLGHGRQAHAYDPSNNMETRLKSGLHIVGRIISMCLRPCPKEHITAPQVWIAKI